MVRWWCCSTWIPLLGKVSMKVEKTGILEIVSHSSFGISLSSDHWVSFNSICTHNLISVMLPLQTFSPQERILPSLLSRLLPEQNPRAADTGSPSVIEKINRWWKKKVCAAHHRAKCLSSAAGLSSTYGEQRWMRWGGLWAKLMKKAEWR